MRSQTACVAAKTYLIQIMGKRQEYNITYIIRLIINERLRSIIFSSFLLPCVYLLSQASTLAAFQESFPIPLPTIFFHQLAWSDYYDKTATARDPHPTLQKALFFLKNDNIANGLAVDLGCGTGRDTLFLLENGWNVFAIDAEEQAIAILLNRINENQSARLTVAVISFADMLLPEGVSLINASFSLPFCSPDHFQDCWQKIFENLVIGGMFCGHFFGDRDEWANKPFMTHHTYAQLMNLFSDRFEIKYFLQEEGALPTAVGVKNHWHIFHVVAKKVR